MNVQKISTWVPISYEDIVDFGIGAPELQAEAASWLATHEAASRAAWRALPWWARATRRLRWRWAEYRARIDRASRALRGGEPEDD